MHGEAAAIPARPWLPAPESVRYGEPAAAALPKVLSELGRGRVFLLVSRSLRQGTDEIARIQRALGDACVGMYDGMPQHTPRSEVLKVAALVRDSGADLLVTVGGGSLIDAGKAVQICMAHGAFEDDALRRLRGWRKPPGGHPSLTVRMVAVPTTLSGGEYTNTAGVTDAEGKKDPYHHPQCAPQIVILDPALTLHTPEWLWLSTGMRGVDHCVEGLCQLRSPQGSATAYSDGLGAAGLHLLAGGLRRCRERPTGLAARLDCLIGVFFAVHAYALSPGVGKGTCHALGHILGGAFGVPHGYTSCVMMPAVLRWSAADSRAAERQRAVTALLGGGTSAAEAALELATALGMPRSLAEVGVKADSFPRAAKLAMRHAGIAVCPRPVRGAAAVEEILALAAVAPPRGKAAL
eukprot:TRINITY_DN23446_c0_g1_i2.p1 TRINITY_DN23446_c0_g1~~TRINITY_DN23446_c0_g1_i2.p1  ORF type:complete len:408 (+),score=83.96 TRINITY_DN23446_c0_g1_i2:97-1320(+)